MINEICKLHKDVAVIDKEITEICIKLDSLNSKFEEFEKEKHKFKTNPEVLEFLKKNNDVLSSLHKEKDDLNRLISYKRLTSSHLWERIRNLNLAS